MDLNCLLFQHQVSLVRATDAVCEASRSAHRTLARGYAARINAMQRGSGALARLRTEAAHAVR